MRLRHLPSSLTGASNYTYVTPTNTGYGSQQSLSYSATGWRNCWYWTAVSIRVHGSASSFAARLYLTGATTSASAYLDRVSLVRGRYVREPS